MRLIERQEEFNIISTCAPCPSSTNPSSFHHTVRIPPMNSCFRSPRRLEQHSLECTDTGNTLPRITRSSLSIRIRSILKHLRSIFTTTETKGFSSAVSDQNTNIIMGLKRKRGHVDVDRSNNDLKHRHRRYRYQRAKLSAFTETGQAELSIEVPKQRSYTGPGPAVPCSVADTPCATLGVQGVLDRLNASLGTSHMLNTVILEDFIERNYDFGTAHAFLRPVWNTKNPSSIQDELRRREGKDRECRQKALEGNRIVDPNLRPRRVWDLYSNRVVPSWITEEWPMPISHAWVDEKDRVDVLTPINGKEWPVPIPKDADLNLIRIEMLNLGAEYAWLDVLCLRQKGGPREDLRVEEWRLDVPTIGYVYNYEKVIIYLSGLGRPLRLKDGDLDSDRSWFRRAWTVQEVTSKRIIAGDMPDGPMHAQRIDGGNYETALLTRFHEEWHSVERGAWHIFAALADMQKRVSTNPVDRVAGLAFPLRVSMIPAYYESETLEDAWTALVNAMDHWMRAGFLFVYPGVGLGCKKWRPTWDQVMMEPLPKDVDFLYAHVWRDDKTDEDWFEGYCIEKGYVRVFDAGPAEGCDRCGELVVTAADGIAHTFKIHVTHRFPIPEDTYTLLSNPWSHQLAVGRRLPDQRFEKVSVIVMDLREERLQLKFLSVAAISRNILV
ncbi:hypothetical protein EV421DRAFT_938706 [Armillaria borealis]|uniref:Heterokaryon incompatibility domain-containing protein n=1 Tax=Armillaria borealis TaxID=47425 RepID=A0AA39JB67_9AGAR|nr:hypothetical protein EV421DRAFT_938706 [Armillaria borealis]